MATGLVPEWIKNRLRDTELRVLIVEFVELYFYFIYLLGLDRTQEPAAKRILLECFETLSFAMTFFSPDAF